MNYENITTIIYLLLLFRFNSVQIHKTGMLSAFWGCCFFSIIIFILSIVECMHFLKVHFNNLQVDQQLNIGHVHSFNCAWVFECLRAFGLGCRTLLPSSKRGAVHLTARKTTQMLANRIFVKLPILKIGCFLLKNKFKVVGPGCNNVCN